MKRKSHTHNQNAIYARLLTFIAQLSYNYTIRKRGYTMSEHNETKPIKRLNAVLPEVLGVYVSTVTGKGGTYETPSEYIRDLIRRDMQHLEYQEKQEVESLLLKSLKENDYSEWTEKDAQELQHIADK